jgi:hypothetical protein
MHLAYYLSGIIDRIGFSRIQDIFLLIVMSIIIIIFELMNYITFTGVPIFHSIE